MMSQFDLQSIKDTMRAVAQYPECWALHHLDSSPRPLARNSALGDIVLTHRTTIELARFGFDTGLKSRCVPMGAGRVVCHPNQLLRTSSRSSLGTAITELWL